MNLTLVWIVCPWLRAGGQGIYWQPERGIQFLRQESSSFSGNLTYRLKKSQGKLQRAEHQLGHIHRVRCFRRGDEESPLDSNPGSITNSSNLGQLFNLCVLQFLFVHNKINRANKSHFSKLLQRLNERTQVKEHGTWQNKYPFLYLLPCVYRRLLTFTIRFLQSVYSIPACPPSSC